MTHPTRKSDRFTADLAENAALIGNLWPTALAAPRFGPDQRERVVEAATALAIIEHRGGRDLWANLEPTFEEVAEKIADLLARGMAPDEAVEWALGLPPSGGVV